ncbi:MAG: phage holin, LLH family [Clostridia bacterium]
MKKFFRRNGDLTLLAVIAMMAVATMVILMDIPAMAEAMPAAQTAAQPVASIDLTQIVTALLGVLATVVTAYMVPWLRGKIGEENYRRSLVVAETLVKAAEQIYGAGKGKEKLQYVKAEMIKRGMTFDADAVEAAVWDLTGALGMMETETATATEG